MPGRTPKRRSVLMVGLDGSMDERAYTFVFLITFASTFLTAFLALYAWRYRETRAAAPFAWLMLAVTVWSLAIAVGMISASIEQAYFWIIVRMISVLSAPVLWLIFALEFTNNAAWPNRGYVLLLFAVPVLSLTVLLTNDWHSLFITNIVYRRTGFYLIDITWSLGPWFWVNFIYSYSLIAVGMFALLREALQLSRQYRRQALAILVGALFPLVTNFILTSRWIVQLEANLDPLGFAISGLILSFALFRFRLFRLSPIARRMLIDNIGDAMLVCDERGWLVDLNPAAETLLETKAEAAIGAPAEKLLQDFPEVRHLMQTGQPASMEFEHPGGAQRAYYDARLFPIWSQKNQIGRLIVIQDITTRKLLEQRLRELATSDDLTGLYTRRHFFERGQAELLRARRYQRPLALFMLDVDRFKRVNDTAGHLVGDRVLQEIAALCRQSLRETDLLARYGGEEFVVLLPETDEGSAQKSAERLRQLIDEQPVKTAARPVSVTVSVGVAAYSGSDELTFDELLQRADRALYLSKARGRNRVTVWQAKEQFLISNQDVGPP